MGEKSEMVSQRRAYLAVDGHELTSPSLAFQIAVALAESQGQKDKQGRTLIKSEHLKATVQMSRDFMDYRTKLFKQDDSKRAAVMGLRYDAYDATPSKQKESDIH